MPGRPSATPDRKASRQARPNVRSRPLRSIRSTAEAWRAPHRNTEWIPERVHSRSARTPLPARPSRRSNKRRTLPERGRETAPRQSRRQRSERVDVFEVFVPFDSFEVSRGVRATLSLVHAASNPKTRSRGYRLFSFCAGLDLNRARDRPSPVGSRASQQGRTRNIARRSVLPPESTNEFEDACLRGRAVARDRTGFHCTSCGPC
jgi:hypothetical protein